MELQLLDYTLEDLQWSERTALNGKSLSVSIADLQEQIKDLSHGIQIDYELARPGESKRIVHVLDTVLPIAKLNGSGSTFPGFEGAAQLVGTGQTIRIRNLLVTIAARFPHPEAMTPIEKPREGMIDMAGDRRSLFLRIGLFSSDPCADSRFFRLQRSLRPGA